MSQQIIDLGTGPDSDTGDDFFIAFTKINSNFTELYSVFDDIVIELLFPANKVQSLKNTKSSPKLINLLNDINNTIVDDLSTAITKINENFILIFNVYENIATIDKLIYPKLINLGNGTNNGDTFYQAFTKINENFTELYEVFTSTIQPVLSLVEETSDEVDNIEDYENITNEEDINLFSEISLTSYTTDFVSTTELSSYDYSESYLIDLGAGPNTQTGDDLYDAFSKINRNFTELYSVFGGNGISEINANVIVSNNIWNSGNVRTNEVFAYGNVEAVGYVITAGAFYPNGIPIGSLDAISTNIVPISDGFLNLGSENYTFSNLYLSNSVVISGANIAVESGLLLIDGSPVNNYSNANVGNYLPIYTGNTAAILTTTSQPYVTQLGTLTNLDALTANINGNLVVSGNLSVEGNITYFNIRDLSVVDPIISLNTGPNGSPLITDNGFDSGVKTFYYDNQNKEAFFGRIDSTGYFEYYSNVISEIGNIISGTYGTIKTGNLILTENADINGNITANYFTGNGRNLTDINSIYDGSSAIVVQNSGPVLISTEGFSNVVVINSSSTNINGNLYISDTISATEYIGNVTGNITAPGNNTEIIFNDDGLLSASSGLTFTSSTNSLVVSGNLQTSANIIVNGYTVVDNTGNLVTARLENSGVIVGTYGNASAVPIVTVDEKGRITHINTTPVAGVSNVTYEITDSNLSIFTSAGTVFSVNLGVGTNNSPVFAGTTITGNLFAESANANTIITDGTAYLYNISSTGLSTLTTLDVLGNANVVANIDVNNVNVTNRITSSEFSVINITATNISVTGNVDITGNLNSNIIGQTATFSGNVDAENINGTNLIVADVSSTTGTFTGNVATGNISTSILIASNRTYANTGIFGYGTDGSGLIGAPIYISGNSTTSLIGTNGLANNVESNLTIKTLNSNISLQIAGADETWTFDTMGDLTAPGNVNASRFNSQYFRYGTSGMDIPVANGEIYFGVNNVGSVTFYDTGIQTLNLLSLGNISGVTINGTTANITGNIVSGNIVTGNIDATNLTGTNLSVTTVNATSGVFSGNVTAGNLITTGVYASTIGNTGSLITGTLTTASQPNITSVGSTLTIGEFNFSNNTIFSTSDTITIEPVGIGSTGNVILQGNLRVTGNVTRIDSEVVSINGKNILLANNKSNISDLNDAGITIGNASGINLVTLKYNTLINSWQTNVGFSPTGNVNLDLGTNSTYWANLFVDNINSTTINGTLQTSAQPNITSLGTLTALSVNGEVTSINVTANSLTINNSANIGSNLNVTGNINASYFIGNIIGNISGNISSPGSNTEILFNDNGLISADSGITYDKSSNQLTVIGNISAGNVSGTILSGTNLVVTDVNATTGTFSGNISANTLNGNIFGSTGIFSGNVSTGNVSGTTLSGTNLAVVSVNSVTGTFVGNVTTGNISGTTLSGTNLIVTNISADTGTFSGNILVDTLIGNISGTTGSFSGNVTTGNVSGTTLSGITGTFIGNVTSNNLIVTNQVQASDISISANAYFGNISTSGRISTTNSTDATSNVTGAVTITGGIGVGKNMYVGNAVGWVYPNSVSAVYQVFNPITNSLDTIFG